MTITQALEKYTDAWMEIHGVIGTGEGRADDGKPAIIVYAERMTDTIEKKIPKSVEGYKVTIKVTGNVEAR